MRYCRNLQKKKKKQIQQQNCLELIKKSATNARP